MARASADPQVRPAKGTFRDLDPRVYILSVAALVRSSGRSASWIFLPLILYLGYGLPLLYVGLLISALVPLSVVVNLLGGVSADRYGRRMLAMLPPFGSAVAFLALYVYWHSGLGFLMALWAVVVVLINLQQPAQNAMLGDITRTGDRTLAFGIQRVFSNAGFALAPALGGILAGVYGLSIVFVMSAITSAGEGIILLGFLTESYGGTERPSSPERARAPEAATKWSSGIRYPFSDRFLLSFGLLGFGLTLATQQFGTPLSLFLESVQHLPYSQIGLVYSLNGVVVVLLQIPISWAVQRRRLLWMAVGTLLYGASFLALDVSPGFLPDLGAITILTVGEDITSPLQNAVLSGLSGPSRRGSYFGAYNVFTSTAQAIAPSLGTLLLSIGYPFLWLPFAFVTVLVAGGYSLMYRRQGDLREAPPGPEEPPGTPSPVTPTAAVTGGKHAGFGHSGP